MAEKQYMSFSWGPHLVASIVSDEFVTTLLDKGEEVRKPESLWNHKLAGKIKEEYIYDNDYKKWFPPLFHQHLVDYLDKLPHGHTRQTMKSWKKGFMWSLEALWINYQGPKEYNPPHNHEGDLSFVIYADMPEEIIEESKKQEIETGKVGPGNIVFDAGDSVYSNFLSFYNNTVTFLPETKLLLIFPSYLTHHVYAFESDATRISVSGNIKIKEQE